jgi:hypothetical protein
LDDLHDYFNDEFFIPNKTPLPKPVFTLSGGRKVAGRFMPGKWYSMDGKTARDLAEEIERGNIGASIIRKTAVKPDEINIHSEVGLNKSFERVAAQVWHETVHQAQFHYPQKYGAPGSGTYHNVNWHQLARTNGLSTSGFNGDMEITPEFLGWLASFPEPERWAARIPTSSATGGKNKQLLWRCKCKRIRAAVELDVFCNDCRSKFKRIDPLP